MFLSRIIISIADRFIYTSLVRCISGVHLSSSLIIRGFPIIHTVRGASVEIHPNVTLNSRNARYHANMHSPVKILADKPGANIVIGSNTRIHGACVHAFKSISIGANCLIAANTQILDCNAHDLSFIDVKSRIRTSGSPKPIKIEDSVWIGLNSIILPGDCYR